MMKEIRMTKALSNCAKRMECAVFRRCFFFTFQSAGSARCGQRSTGLHSKAREYGALQTLSPLQTAHYFLADLYCSVGAPEKLCGARQLRQFFAAEQLIEAKGKIFDAVDLKSGATFEHKVAIGGFLAGDWIQNEQRFP